VIETVRDTVTSIEGSAPRATANALDWNVNLLNLPADGARRGGDWCDTFPISDEAVALTIGDVSGHGELVAETMETLRSAVFLAMRDTADPSKVLSIANTVAYSRGDGVIVTAIVAILNRRLRTLTFANAGHPAPFIMTAAAHGFLGRMIGDLPLGIVPNHCAADYVVALPADVQIVLYTDGVTEHNRDVLLGTRELVDACRAVYDYPVPNAACAIAWRVFQKVRGHDDAAVAVLRELPMLAKEAASSWLYRM
jgi:serine phosphatase RsbU (regulator of sigma subunit)